MSHRGVVSDSSVLIDLERGSFFAAAFALPLDFCVPDLLYRLELQSFGSDRLLSMGLKVLDLDGAGVVQPASVTNFRREGVEAPSCLVARTGRRCRRT